MRGPDDGSVRFIFWINRLRTGVCRACARTFIAGTTREHPCLRCLGRIGTTIVVIGVRLRSFRESVCSRIDPSTELHAERQDPYLLVLRSGLVRFRATTRRSARRLNFTVSSHPVQGANHPTHQRLGPRPPTMGGGRRCAERSVPARGHRRPTATGLRIRSTHRVVGPAGQRAAGTRQRPRVIASRWRAIRAVFSPAFGTKSKIDSSCQALNTSKTCR